MQNFDMILICKTFVVVCNLVNSNNSGKFTFKRNVMSSRKICLPCHHPHNKFTNQHILRRYGIVYLLIFAFVNFVDHIVDLVGMNQHL